MPLPFSLSRTIDIRARRATVFRFFTDPAQFARWWGDGSTIDAVVGGAVCIRYPTGDTASGVVREIVAERMIAFTYGYDDPGKPIPPGGSLVTITLSETPTGTQVELRHDVGDAATRDDHVDGWRHQLAVFARIVAAEVFSADAIAVWFAAWNDPAPREQLAACAAATVAFRDAYGCTAGIDELAAYIAAVARFMPGIRLEPRGAPRHAHATALADWAMMKAGTAIASGTNVFRLDADGKIVECIGVAG
jgi:uncharacterized protein YndB with AHSA1/START domain